MKDDTISRQAVVDLVEEVENKRLRGEIDLTYAPMIKGIKALPLVESEYTAVTPEEVAAEVACGSINSSIYWGNILIQIEQMGYVICKKKKT